MTPEFTYTILTWLANASIIAIAIVIIMIIIIRLSDNGTKDK